MHVSPYRSAIMTGNFASGARVYAPRLMRTKQPVAAAAVSEAWRFAGEPSLFASSQLAGAVRIVGDIYAQDHLFLDGEVNGKVIAPNHGVTIGPNAFVR